MLDAIIVVLCHVHVSMDGVSPATAIFDNGKKTIIPTSTSATALYLLRWIPGFPGVKNETPLLGVLSSPR